MLEGDEGPLAQQELWVPGGCKGRWCRRGSGVGSGGRVRSGRRVCMSLVLLVWQ